MPTHPLAEVFGYPPEDRSEKAERHQAQRLCPFNNKVPNCTKDKADDPLGVCSLLHGGKPVITCPVRFRQDWQIVTDAAGFFFPNQETTGRKFTSLTEVRLDDADGRSAGNIDVVLVEYDPRGHITDFGALEVQAVYVSGNVRRPFEHFMAHRNDPGFVMGWSGQRNYPNPDYLSSSRKRLAPQLWYKGGILKGWGKKQSVAIQHSFYRTLPPFPQVAESEAATADMVWLLYDLDRDPTTGHYGLVLKERVYSLFEPTLTTITTSRAGPVESFVEVLRERLARAGIKRDEDNPPDAPTLFDLLNPPS
jgi:Restriction endonuclease NotI